MVGSFGVKVMKQKLTAQAIHDMIARLADPEVNFRINLASTTYVARRIIHSLPGVEELRQNGPEVAQALLARLQKEETLTDHNFTAISLRILENYPSESVKLALARPIVSRKFTGFSNQFAAEAFLKAAGIEAGTRDPSAVAMREARKIVKPQNLQQKAPQNPQQKAPQNLQQKAPANAPPK